jgi:hypothetical protein
LQLRRRNRTRKPSITPGATSRCCHS